MKTVMTLLTLVAISSPALAHTLLSCKGTGSGGSLVKTIQLENTRTGLVLKTIDYAGEKHELKVVKTLASSVSTSYIPEQTGTEKSTFVANLESKQAVMVYESVVSRQRRSVVEFLLCK